jgi:hypothetical protein
MVFMPLNLYIIVWTCNESKLICHPEQTKYHTKTGQPKNIAQNDEQTNNVALRRQNKKIITQIYAKNTYLNRYEIKRWRMVWWVAQLIWTKGEMS